MDNLSTIFPTICPLKNSLECCLFKEKSLSTFDELKNFFNKKAPELDFCLEKINPQGYRLKAKLAVRKVGSEIMIGLFKEGSHDIVDKQGCFLHHELINEAIGKIKGFMKELNIEPYDEKKHEGTLRYVQFLVNEAGGLQIVFVATIMNDQLNDLVKRLSLVYNNSSIWCNIQNKITNTIFSEHFEHIAGPKWFSYQVFQKKIFFHPGSFCQANLLEFVKIIEFLDTVMTKKSKALDLYSGVGLFGLALHEHFDEVIFAETNLFSYEAFQESKKNIPHTHFEFFVSDAKEILKKNLDADVIFIDPPRKGLEKEIKPLFGDLKKGAELVYISCGAASLIRDLNEILPLGFIIKKARSYQFFPGSKELETLCILEKVI